MRLVNRVEDNFEVVYCYVLVGFILDGFYGFLLYIRWLLVGFVEVFVFLRGSRK